MKLLIGKTFYLTNEYLHKNENSSGIIAESNISTIKKNYNCLNLPNLNEFYKESDVNEVYILNENLDKKYKRPKSILLENNEQKILFLRDDIFPLINEKIKQDPVIDYNEYSSIENKLEKDFINKLYETSLKDRIDYNTFIFNYNNQKNIGNISFEYEKEFSINLNIESLITVSQNINKYKFEK